jgi:SAM-dependent methyltransferase
VVVTPDPVGSLAAPIPAPTAPPEHYNNVTPWNIDGAMRYWMVTRLFSDLYSPDLEIAEIGSGSAGITEFLDHPVTGVDPAFERTAERANPRLTRVLGSAADLPFADATFDVVLCLEMMEHLPHELRAPSVQEMLRVLRPGGRLVLTFPADATATRLDTKLNAAFRKKKGMDHPWAVEHLQHGVPATEEIRRLVAEQLGPHDALEVRKHSWAPAWLLQQMLFSVDYGYPFTRAIGLHTTPTAKLLFRILRHANFGECYRSIVVVSKGS